MLVDFVLLAGRSHEGKTGKNAERYIEDYRRNHLPVDKNVRGATVRKAYFPKRERSVEESVQSRKGSRKGATTAVRRWVALRNLI